MSKKNVLLFLLFVTLENHIYLMLQKAINKNNRKTNTRTKFLKTSSLLLQLMKQKSVYDKFVEFQRTTKIAN